ncbi:MAG: TolC family protein [Vicinamibacteraceae bacterium]
MMIVACSLTSAGARAQEPDRNLTSSPPIDRAAGLSLADAIARAREREPALRAARADVEVARGQRVQSGLRPNPTTTVESRQEPGGTDSLFTVGIEWPLDLFRRGGRIATADRQVEASRWSVADRERLLVADVRTQYGRAAAAAREADLTAELAATVDRQFGLLRARADEGAAARLDADRLEVELRRLQSQRDLATGRAERAVIALKPMLGLEPQEPLQLRDTLEMLVGAPRQTPSTANAEGSLAERPDVQAAARQVAIADARIEQAKREGRLDVSLTAGYMRMDAGFSQLGFSVSGLPERVRGQFNYVSVGAMVMLPVLNRNQGQLAAAQADRSGAEERQRAVRLGAATERAAAMARDTRARQAMSAYGDATRSLARRNLDAVRQTFELGRATMSDVLAEQQRYLEFESSHTATLLEAWEAHVERERASGDSK